MNIFKEIVLSIYHFESYQKFLKNRKSKVFCFGLLLVLVHFSFTIRAPALKFVIADGGVASYLEETIPEFELKNGFLSYNVSFSSKLVFLSSHKTSELPVISLVMSVTILCAKYTPAILNAQRIKTTIPASSGISASAMPERLYAKCNKILAVSD